MLNTVMDWDALDAFKYADEVQCVEQLLAAVTLSPAERNAIVAEAAELVAATRQSRRRQGVVESFLQQFSLGTREGVALMCLAEALLRTPDAETRDRLIAEKIGSADWAAHIGGSQSLFVNASTWGLMLTGKLVDVESETRADPAGWLLRLVARAGEPVIRQAVVTAVRIMGKQFVLGQTMADALARAREEAMLCSFDMLGEGARSAADAERYEQLYAEAIEAVGVAAAGAGPERGHGVSVKLSALSPRYEAVQQHRVEAELLPRLIRLARQAARHNLNFAIDAEEADRLVLSLKLVDHLASLDDLASWQGLGVVVQAYQKRGRRVIGQLAELAQRRQRRIMVRLVKGAYWDSEIKRAQVAGRSDYPVFTTKAATDVSYLLCADALISASPNLYPQFATHNAHTLSAVRHLAARRNIAIEFQRLHGMGEALYEAAAARYGPLRLRAYAPVGGHEELLPYLVRRLLENGANTSFVHALLNDDVPPHAVAADPVAALQAQPGRHARLPLPTDLYGRQRPNPLGRDYTIVAQREQAARELQRLDSQPVVAGPIIHGERRPSGPALAIANPANTQQRTGTVHHATPDDLDTAIHLAMAAQPQWNDAGGAARAGVLRAMADALDGAHDPLVALLAREAGKTLNDGVAEVREAIDFCRYYATLAEQQFGDPLALPGPAGETNQLSLSGRGIFACISPWNFPLAIFTGQIAAALAAGNAVIAKPAEQTPLVAANAVQLFHQAGLDARLLAMLPGGAEIGRALTAHPGISGVAFTGGTDTAASINRTLAARDGPIIPFIAETGGLNGMFVDTTALREQVVDDALLSAFGSAGQRCSALRLLYIPEESADELLATLCGALDALVIGDPADPSTDIGPVIDAQACEKLEAHASRLARDARIVARARLRADLPPGHWFAPVIAEVSQPDYLEREVFGPILHVYRYKAGQLPEAAQALRRRGYGLTLGIHSRVQGFADQIRQLVPAGNSYVNRSMTGAVVGVQPFGGEGLSGTGPKAGGPHALLRYATEHVVSVNVMAQGGDPALLNL